MVITFVAVIAGAEDFTEFKECELAQEEWLGGFLDLHKGIPSHDTLNRVLTA